MLKKLKEFSFPFSFVCLTLLIVVTMMIEGIIAEWNWNVPADSIIITKKWIILLPFSISYNWNFLIAGLLSILIFFLLPKEVLQGPKNHVGSKYSFFAISAVSLALAIFYLLFGFIAFFILFWLICFFQAIGNMTTEIDLDHLDNNFLYAETAPPEELLNFNYELAEKTLKRYSIVTFFTFHFLICLLKGIVTGIFFAIVFALLSFVFRSILNLMLNKILAEGEKETQEKISVVTES